MFNRKNKARLWNSSGRYVIALGGGGARGLAHIGVLKVLQREGIKISGVAGTSMGAIVGAMFAYFGDAMEVEELFRKFLSSQFHEKFGKTFFLLSENPDTYHEPKKIIKKLGRSYIYLKAASRNAVFSGDILKDTLGFLLPDIEFVKTRIPFVCVSTDLLTGKEIIFKRGRLIPAVIASSSIPGIVEPMKIGDSILVDGSTTSAVPVDAARRTFSSFKPKVIAIDVSMELKRYEEPSTAFEVALRSSEISDYYLNVVSLEKADFVIHPNVGRANWANFDRLDELIRSGETAAVKSLFQFKNRR
ncbi:MAG: patatin-like phospholipase family protein [Candidatus Kryptoniota bacterium]